MHDLNRFRIWFLAFISVLLLIPVLHLYDYLTAPARVKHIAADFAHLSEHYELARDIEHLVSDARAYVLHMDGRYLDEFDRRGVVVVTREMDLYNRAASVVERKALKKMIDLTEAYISSFRNDVVPLLESGRAGSLGLYREKCEPQAAELREVSRETLAALRDGKMRSASGATAMENSIWMFTIFLTVASLALLAYGVRQIVNPMLLRYHQFENFADRTGEILVAIDRRGRVTTVNPAAEKLLCMPAGEVAGESLNSVLVRYPPLQGLLQPLLNVALKGAETVNNQVVFTSGGQRLLLSADYHPLFSLPGMCGALMVAYPLEIHKDKRYLFDAIEAERKKISIEIHDWVGRNMSAIIHSLDFILKTGAGRVPADLHQDLVRLRSQCQGAAMDMRGIMNDIHPYLIDKVGLLSALESYVTGFEQLHGVKVYIFYRNRALNLGRAEEIIVYRIIQEALANVVKHSNAGEVDIYFKESDGTLRVEIADNGTPPEDLVMGNGLWGMKERANLIGGDLVYNSSENGFAIIVTVPVAAEGNSDEPGKNNAG